MYTPDDVKLTIGGKEIKGFSEEPEIIDPYLTAELKINGEVFVIKMKSSDLRYIEDKFWVE